MILNNSNTRYRADIDGLRALAVLPVVAFHAGIHIVRGGFVGVDVFFVISGYLITQHIFSEIVNDRFSILSFYERRIRRILPALVAVLFVTYLLGLVYCLPAEMVDLAKSLVAAALSISNVYFYFGSGYFDTPALARPLLHTWSLAVEEQFYLFWPIFLILSYRLAARRVLPITLIVAAVSFVASVIGTARYPTGSFYLPFTRIWELAIGGLLPLGVIPLALGPKTRNILGACGLVLIAASVMLIDSTQPFPGILALPPCLGAVCILLAGRDGDSVVGRALAFRPITFFGIISYSLYLWHWPIVVFQKNYTFLASGLSDPASKLLIIAVSTLAAAASWQFIEQPFRTGPHRPSKVVLFRLAGISTVALVAVASLAWLGGGFPSRYSQQELEVAKLLDYSAASTYRSGICFLDHTEKDERFAPDCLALSPTKKNYLLLGDSHAAELWFGLHSVQKDANFLQATSIYCYPTLTHRFDENQSCISELNYVIEDFLLSHSIDNVLISARWKQGMMGSIAQTIEWMVQHHLRVTLIGPSPEFDAAVPRLIISSLRKEGRDSPQQHLDHATIALDQEMSQWAKTHGIDYVSMIDLLCRPLCLTQDKDGLPLIFDREHFTADGSIAVAERLSALPGIW